MNNVRFHYSLADLVVLDEGDGLGQTGQRDQEGRAERP